MKKFLIYSVSAAIIYFFIKLGIGYLKPEYGDAEALRHKFILCSLLLGFPCGLRSDLPENIGDYIYFCFCLLPMYSMLTLFESHSGFRSESHPDIDRFWPDCLWPAMLSQISLAIGSFLGNMIQIFFLNRAKEE